jgi:hypothetical protein
MIDWLLERIGLVVFVLIFVSQVVRAMLRSRKAAEEHKGHRDASAEERRVKEIQEKIRRQIAERRGAHIPTAPPPPLTEAEPPPVARPETTQMPQPFGGPLGRMLEELQKRAQPRPAAPPPVVHARHNVELERQFQLADELKAAEEMRVLADRRAALVTADRKAEAESETGLRSVAREQLLVDLNDSRSLRRAFLLREVLGPPVGMR